MTKTLWSRLILSFSCCLVVLISGCGRTIPSPASRFDQAEKYAATDSRLQSHVYRSPLFDLFAYQTPSGTSSKAIHVYIEGDGLAWKTSSLISDDPTPLNPLALQLMLLDPAEAKMYLGRPCQYVTRSSCHRKYWTSHRFAPEVIDSYQRIFDQIKGEYGVSAFVVFGYSGGGAIATLLAAQRDDISLLVTIAGNIDTQFWTKKHYITPLSGSLNPADYAMSLQTIKQFHLVGSRDKIIDESIFLSYQEKFADKGQLNLRVYDGFDHSSGWLAEWPIILQTINR